jgi:hypothetical protein
MKEVKNDVINAISDAARPGIDEFVTLISHARSGTGDLSKAAGDLPGRIFQIFPDPADNRRSLSTCLVTISSWTLQQLLDRFDACKGQTAIKLYLSLAQVSEAAPLRGILFEMQVLAYLDCLATEKVFSIRSLAANSDQKMWTYRGPIPRVKFDKSSFSGQIQEAITQKKAQHLVPNARNFAAVDSIIYDPKDSFLTLIQVTRNVNHPIAVAGLGNVQSWLKPKTGSAKLRPTKKRPWRLVFLVPSNLESDFKRQPFTGDTDKGEWAGKVDQYVLGLEENLIFRISQ